MFSSVFRF